MRRSGSRGPFSVTAIECSKWAASEPSAVTTVQSSGWIRDVVAAEGEHRLDGQAQAGLELAARAAGPVVGDLRLLVHLGADAVADELADDAAARRGAATSSTAAEMSSMWLPGTAAAIPAIIASRVRSMSSATSGGGSPTKKVRAPSPCQPSTIAPASTETIWPARIVRSPGMPWTISSSIEMQTLAGNGRRGLMPG